MLYFVNRIPLIQPTELANIPRIMLPSHPGYRRIPSGEALGGRKSHDRFIPLGLKAINRR
jgi:hypothetical protein